MRQKLLFEMPSLGGVRGQALPESQAAVETAKDQMDGAAHRAVSPLGRFCLREACGHCGREIGPSGCIIPDFEELGAFCSQDCADRRFRIYLENEA